MRHVPLPALRRSLMVPLQRDVRPQARKAHDRRPPSGPPMMQKKTNRILKIRNGDLAIDVNAVTIYTSTTSPLNKIKILILVNNTPTHEPHIRIDTNLFDEEESTSF
jgi:hypothetical protein